MHVTHTPRTPGRKHRRCSRAERQSTCLARVRPWFPSPALPREQPRSDVSFRPSGPLFVPCELSNDCKSIPRFPWLSGFGWHPLLLLPWPSFTTACERGWTSWTLNQTWTHFQACLGLQVLPGAQGPPAPRFRTQVPATLFWPAYLQAPAGPQPSLGGGLPRLLPPDPLPDLRGACPTSPAAEASNDQAAALDS